MKKLICSIIVAGAAVFSMVVVTSVGCGSPDQVGNGGGGGGVAGNPIIKMDGSPPGVAGSSGSAGSGVPGPTPTADANCGSQTSSTTHKPADVLLVLDRSGSMGDDIAEDCNCVDTDSSSPACPDRSTCKDRWSTVGAAINSTVSSTPDIHWGLKLYSTPGGRTCEVSSQVEVPIGADSASAIQSTIQGTTPSSYTPTAAAIKAATAYLKTVDDTSNKVILLATDGLPNCASSRNPGDSDREGTLSAIEAAKDAGYPVYVIGIGPSVGNLNDFADAGGTGQYYPATSPQDLANALTSISTLVVTCTFTLVPLPGADLTNLAVYLDKKLVVQDPVNGWSFGSNAQTIVLNGTSCDMITSGQATTVEVLFGCPGVAPPQTIP
ncbi:MAG: VWA domain-containing protein [Deltaproteobacteria bacterium]|nr:VWA domain-containing protein [Deltaproteobacteria bacterium]